MTAFENWCHETYGLMPDQLCMLSGRDLEKAYKAGRTEPVEYLTAALEWLDSAPAETPLPTMPGFDRDYVNSVIADEAPSLYTEYYGRAHAGGDELVCPLPRPLTYRKVCQVINLLNRNAHVYGITYYLKDKL